MTLAQQSPEWMTQAACLDVDPELFFPVESKDTDSAVAICGTCPVRAECLAYAIDLGVEGVWGGLTQRQRGKRYVCRGCSGPVGSYRYRHCDACRAQARAEQKNRSARERRIAS